VDSARQQDNTGRLRRPAGEKGLQTSAFEAAYPVPSAGGFCNEIAAGSDGAACVSDTENSEVVRLPNGGHQLEGWAENGGFGSKGGVPRWHFGAW
jgi:hypothetical protein